MIKKTFAASIILILLLISGYWLKTQGLYLPVDEQVLKLSLDHNVESLDPAKAYSDDSLVVSAQIVEPLFQYHYLKRPYEIEPLLAEAMPAILDKGLRIRIKIKKNVRFHDHPAFKNKVRYLKAEDFVFQIKRLALDSLKSPGRSLFSGLILGFSDYSSQTSNDWRKIKNIDMKGVRAIDDHTLEILLSRSETNIIYFLALNFVVPMPWEVIEHQKNILDNILIGTGPYTYLGRKEDYLELEKFPEYREDFYPSSGDRYANVQKLLISSKERIPFINRVRFHITAEEKDAWDKFLAGEIDLLNVPKSFLPKLYNTQGEMSQILKDRNIELKHFPTLANRWLAFNMRDKLVGNNEFLRRAIAYSIDYSKYIQLLSQNTNLRANSILVPGISGYQPTKDFRFKYDPELARNYLKMGGFTRPQDMPTITYSTRGNQSINKIEADFIKEMLEAIGLKVKIQMLSFPEFLSKGRAGELMFFTDNWLFDYPDGENILQLLVSTNFPGINKSAYSNPKIDQLYERLKETSIQEQRDEIIRQMEEVVFDDLPWIPMMYESSFVMHYPEIKNFRKSSIIRNYVKYLKIVR